MPRPAGAADCICSPYNGSPGGDRYGSDRYACTYSADGCSFAATDQPALPHTALIQTDAHARSAPYH